MNPKKIISGTGRSLAICLAVFLLFLTVLFGLAQTDMGKRGTARLITAMLSKEGEIGVEIKGLHGLIPFDFHIDRMSFRDSAGQWLVFEDISFRWLPLSLFKGKFHVENLNVKLARLSRLVESKEKPESGSKGLLSRSLPFQWFCVDRFFLEQFSLGDAVLGKHTDFRASGKVLSRDSDGVRSSFLRFDRMNGGAGKLFLKAALRGEEPLLTIDLDVEEDAEGLIPNLLGIRRPITISVHGEGPALTWTGTLQAHIGGIGSLGADIGLAFRDTPTMTVRGVLKPDPGRMPAQILPLFAKEGRFGITASLITSNYLAVDLLTLNAGSTELRLSGRMDLDKGTVDGQFTFECQDLGFLGGSTNLHCAGNLTADGHFSGPILQPRSTVHIKAVGLEVDGFRASALNGDFNLQFLGEQGAVFQGVNGSGIGHVADVSFRDAQNAQRLFPEPRLKWRLDVDVSKQPSIHIRNLEVTGERLTLGASGQVNTAGPGGTFEVLLHVLDTQGFSDLLGFELPGTFHLNARLQGDPFTRLLTAHVQGKMNLFDQKKSRHISSLSGGDLDFSGDFALTAFNRLTASDLRLKTKTGTFVVDASLDLSQRRLDGSWRLSAPELSVFSEALKRDIGGSLHADGKVKGVPGKMTLTGRAVTQDFLCQGLYFDHAAASVHARETASGIVGDLSMALRQANQEAKGRTDFALKRNLLHLSSISVQAPGNQVHGNMTFFLDRDLAEGVLQADCEDLSDPGSLFGKTIQGSVHMETQFQAVGTDQQVLIAMEGRGLASKTGQADILKMSGRLTKLTPVPRGKVALALEGLSFNELSVASLTLVAEGNAHKFNFSGKAAGKYKSGFEIAASGQVFSLQGGLKLNLDRLNGRLGSSILDLASATQIRHTIQGWKFDPFVFHLGQGHIQGSGSCMDGMLDMNIKFKALPLEALQFAGLSGLDGMAAGSIDFSGPVSHPEGGIILRLDQAGLRDRRYRELPPSVLQARVDLKNDHIHADLTLTGLADRPLEFNMKIPVRFSLYPFVWAVRSQENLRGRLAGGLDLAHVFLFMDLPNQDLDGQMEIRLSLDGTAGDPRLEGYARIQDGFYENVTSGTVFKDAELAVAAHNSRLVIERGLMSDGEGGTLSLQGRIDLVPLQEFPFSLELVFDKVALVRQDHANAIAGGRLSFSGSLSEALLTGQLEIISADFQIPKRLPPDVAELEVIEINRVGDASGRPPASALPRNHKIKLDASVLSSGPVFIRGRGLESEWKGKFQLAGSVDQPVVAGNLSVVRGFFNFLGKRFNLKEGRVTLHGAFPPSPSLDVLAEFSTREILARLRLSGPATEPLLELSSEPSLPKDEILARILFGRTVSDITPVQAIQLAQAVDSMAGGHLDVLGGVRRLLGVDQLELKTFENGTKDNNGSQTGIGSAAISVGKYVHEKVYVTTERGLQDESGKVTVEVEVTPNITLETEAREDAEGGVGVKWKWNY